MRRVRTIAIETIKFINKESPLCLHNLVALNIIFGTTMYHTYQQTKLPGIE
jgi:hypothetical protein